MNFEPLHCQMDYGDNSVTIQFEGEFSYSETIEHLKKSYPNFIAVEIVSFTKLSEYKGFKNIGSITFK